MGAVGKIAAGAGLIAAGIFIPGLQGLVVPGIKITVGAIAISVGASVALGGIAQAIQKAKSGSVLNDPRGALATIRQAAAPRRVIYGYRRVGGLLVFANSTGLRAAPTEQVQLVIVLSGHGIDSIVGIKFDDEAPEIDLATGLGLGPWAGKVFYTSKLGYDGDVAFPELITDAPGQWTSDHRLRGCAAAYLRLNYDAKLYPQGIPNATFYVNGKPVFDPRLDDALTIVGATSAESVDKANGTWGIDFVDADHFGLQGTDIVIESTAHGFVGGELARILGIVADIGGAYDSGGQIFRVRYSNNAALVTADYLMDPWIGMGVAWAKINEAVLVAAANVCDESISVDEASPPTTENRYTINGTFETSELPGELLAQMANAMAGHVVYIGGEWHIIPGAFRLPVAEFNDSHVVAPMKVEWKRSRRDLFNSVKGTFASVAHEFVETDFPAVTNADYLAEDQGIAVARDVFFPFTITVATAQRLAKIELERNRRQISLELVCSMAAYEVQPGDVIEFTHARYDWVQKTFEVQECALETVEDSGAPALVVRLKLVEVDLDVYGFAVDEYGNTIDPSLLDLLNRTVPFGWTPGLAPDIQTSAESDFPFSDYRFVIAQQYRLAGDGGIIPQVRIGGFSPLNVFTKDIGRPRRRSLTATYINSGGFIRGGQRYYIAVTAMVGFGSPPDADAAQHTALSDISAVEVTEESPANNSNLIVLSNLRWHPDTEGWQVYFGTDKFRLSRQAAAGYIAGTLGGSVGINGGTLAQPEEIQFAGYNIPAQLPKGYYEHLGGPPDQRFDKLRFKFYRAPHLGVFGGQVVSIQTVGPNYTITLNPTTPFTTDALAGRYITLVGKLGTGLDTSISSGMPRVDFLIESNSADTVTLSTSTVTDPASVMDPLDVVVVRTKATAVGEDGVGAYLEDSAFGEGGQLLGDADPNIGGGDDSLQGMLLRIIAGTGAGTKYLIKSNIVSSSRIYIQGPWDLTPDLTSIFVITESAPAVIHDTDDLATDKLDAFAQFKIDAADLIGEQYVIYGISVSSQNKESAEESSPFRELYVYGAADGGKRITEDYQCTSADRYLRVDPSNASPPQDLTVTLLDPLYFTGMEVIVHNVGTTGHNVYVVAGGSPPGFTVGGELTRTLTDGQARLYRGFND